MPRSNFMPEDFPVFTQVWDTFFSKNNFDVLYISKKDPFIKYFVKMLPKNIKRKFLEK